MQSLLFQQVFQEWLPPGVTDNFLIILFLLFSEQFQLLKAAIKELLYVFPVEIL